MAGVRGAAARRLRGAAAAFITAMRGRGIEAQIGTWHIPMTRWFRERYGFGPGDYPVADDVFERAIALPLWPGMTDDQQARGPRRRRRVHHGSSRLSPAAERR